MTSFARRLAAILVAVAAVPGAVRAATPVEPAAPTDAELIRYAAVQNALAAEAEGSGDLCGALAGEGEDDDAANLAAVARKVEEHPVVGPVLRRQGLSGRRFVEITAQVAGVLLGAAIVEGTAAASGAEPDFAALRASSSAAAPILARRAELTAALEAVGAACGDGE